MEIVEVKAGPEGSKIAVLSDGTEAVFKTKEDGSFTVTIDGVERPVKVEHKPPAPPTPKYTKFTIDGEVYILTNGAEVHPPDVNITQMPGQFRDRHKNALFHIYAFLVEMKAQAPRRQLPMTRHELIEWGVEKRDIAALVDMGFVNERILSVLEEKTKKPVGGRACVYFTPLGKAYLRDQGIEYGK